MEGVLVLLSAEVVVVEDVGTQVEGCGADGVGGVCDMIVSFYL
jgi:hypothetical protein